jgi:hypothetical protein
MTPKSPDEWTKDLVQSQRNIVFPDTAANEARFWRNILSDKRKVTGLQTLSIAVIALVLVAALVGLVATHLRTAEGTLVQRTIASMGDWIVLGAILAAILVVGGIVSRRSSR